MMDKAWRQWFKKKDNFIILILAGILLFVIALPTKNGAGNQSDRGTTLSDSSGVGGTGGSGTDGAESMGAEGTAEDYAKELEQRLTKILSEMADVGRVEVMITLKSSRELVVEKETPVSRSATTETDAQGGSRTVNTSEMEENVIYSTDGSSSEPYVVKSLAPEIEGVLVVAEGAGSGTVNRTVTEIVQALFDVEAHKVKVVKMGMKSE